MRTNILQAALCLAYMVLWNNIMINYAMIYILTCSLMNKRLNKDCIFPCIFTPQPFRLEGYCHNASGGLAAGPDVEEHISLKVRDIVFLFEVFWNHLDLYLYNIMVICLFLIFGLRGVLMPCFIMDFTYK